MIKLADSKPWDCRDREPYVPSTDQIARDAALIRARNMVALRADDFRSKGEKLGMLAGRSISPGVLFGRQRFR